MKNEIKKLIQDKDYSAVLITGPTRHNPCMVYFTGCRHVTNADLIISQGGESVLFYNPMERDEAAATGLTTKSLADYKWNELLTEANGDPGAAVALRYKKMLTDLKIASGRIAVYGQVDAGSSFNILSKLQEIMPNTEIVGESTKNSILLEAMSTKDFTEVERIREMGRITTSVVGEVADFLTSRKVKNGIVLTAKGDPLTIGEVKKRINLMLIQSGVENPHGTIFAIGRDAGIPHSSGNPDDIIELGKTIVFDIFPCEAGGGYHYDFTRTWCLGFAPDDVLAIYEDVKDVYLNIMDELVVNEPFGNIQNRTCELFEAKGHSTIKSDPSTQEGYVHSIGHGVGLHIHEAPWSGIGATEKDILAPGIVATIEPGLYYPSKNMGCRLEDTFTVSSDGSIDILAEFPLDLILEMK
jgi:Xaa-Pro aminopeptidase